MATSSISHNFVISDPQNVERFISAIENSEKQRTPKRKSPCKIITDAKEIAALMAKRKKK